MNNDLISREALNETIEKLTWYHINSDGDLVEGAFDDDALYKAEDIYKAINNAPTASPKEICIANIHFDEEKLKEIVHTEVIDKIESGELVLKDKRPQGDIRWTDKVSLKSNGDIIDFEGRVVGHINLEEMKGGADNDG